MSKFLTGKDLEEKLTDIIWNAKKHITIVSPFIKLDNYVKNILEKIKTRHDIIFYLLFGKNENSKNRSISEEDFNYFTEFKNITILYHKDLHAKHYCNESEGLITSLNLYDYSMINNVEYGVHFTNSLLSTEKLYADTESFTYDLLFKKSEVIFLKKPQYSKSLLGLKKNYQASIVLFDVSEAFFKNVSYEVRALNSFDLVVESSVEKKFSIKPQRDTQEQVSNFSLSHNNSLPQQGYCIRTGEEIPFNPERPMCYNAWLVWSGFENYYYPENYCHLTGEKSYGKTSMANPILEKSLKYK